MSDLLQTLAEQLARDALKQAALTDDEGLVDDVAKSLADTSTTFSEVYLTAVRYYRAEARARQLLPDFQDEENVIALPPPEEQTAQAQPETEEPEVEQEIPYAEAEVVEDTDDETFETGKIRKQAVAAINELKTKGPATRRKWSWWGKAGQMALSVGCVAAAATGQVYLGLPCVIGGAASSAALKLWEAQEKQPQ